jgi:hypothetical protein
VDLAIYERSRLPNGVGRVYSSTYGKANDGRIVPPRNVSTHSIPFTARLSLDMNKTQALTAKRPNLVKSPAAMNCSASRRLSSAWA